jgi:hypothetical protein
MYLTGNPQITYFKVVYRRHTNFSMDDVIIDSFNENKRVYLGKGHHVHIPRYGDLLHKISLIYKGQHVYQGSGLANPATALIDHIELSIGSHEIDRLYGHWIETWYELSKSNPNGTCANVTNMDNISVSHLASAMDVTALTYHKQEALNKAYLDNRLNKLTNILGTGVAYPPTKFQRSARCGGVFCEPTYLQELELGQSETSASFATGNASNTNNGSGSDFSITVGTISASNVGGSAQDTLNNGSFTWTSEPNGSHVGVATEESIKKSQKTGSILGLCVLELPFWFNKDPGLSLPLCALQNHDVDIKIHFAQSSDANWTKDDLTDGSSGKYLAFNGTISNNQNVFNAYNIGTDNDNYMKPMIKSADNSLNFVIDVSALYIYLDSDEKRRFAQVSHEYLIEQIQHQSSNSNDINIDLNFNHPVKEIIWTGKPYLQSDIKYSNTESLDNLNNGVNVHHSGVRFQPGSQGNISGGSILNSSYTIPFGIRDGAKTIQPPHTITDTGAFSSHGKFVAGLVGPSTPSCLDDCNWSLSVNSIERIQPQPLQVFTRLHVDRYHNGFGSVSCPDSIAVYSFALKPEEHQPSGTCNFSKIDKVRLHRYKDQDKENNVVKLNIYAINYNILRIMSGQASIAYTL